MVSELVPFCKHEIRALRHQLLVLQRSNRVNNSRLGWAIKRSPCGVWALRGCGSDWRFFRRCSLSNRDGYRLHRQGLRLYLRGRVGVGEVAAQTGYHLVSSDLIRAAYLANFSLALHLIPMGGNSLNSYGHVATWSQVNIAKYMVSRATLIGSIGGFLGLKPFSPQGEGEASCCPAAA